MRRRNKTLWRASDSLREGAMSSLASELRDIHGNLQRFLASSDVKKLQPVLERLEETANSVGRAWSGSWLGYHARVYYAGLRPPPPGAHFSPEWGLRDAFSMGSSVNLPRFGGHPRSHESAVGVCHGQTEAAGVHEGIQS